MSKCEKFHYDLYNEESQKEEVHDVVEITKSFVFLNVFGDRELWENDQAQEQGHSQDQVSNEFVI